MIGAKVLDLPFSTIVNLDHPAHYIHWNFFQMSVPNLIVIALMIVIFVAAILLPFPNRGGQS